MAERIRKGNEREECAENIDAKLEHHWPEKEVAKLEHQFKLEGPCPVKVTFDEAPAKVVVSSDPQNPLNVNMDMNIRSKEPIKHMVCVKLCEPVCAKSDYTIGIRMRDKPFAAISLTGMTRVYNCRDSKIEPTRTCINFKQMKVGTATETEFVVDGVTFSPVKGLLRIVATGEPSGQAKLGFWDDGVAIRFPEKVHGVRITVNNYGSSELKFIVYSEDIILTSFTESVENTSKQVAVDMSGITSIVVSGGRNEAAIVELCYLPDPSSISITHASYARGVRVKGIS